MTSLHIILLLCPLAATSPHQCQLGFEESGAVYASKDECQARAREMYEAMARELYQRGAVLRISCVEPDVYRRFRGQEPEKGYSA